MNSLRVTCLCAVVALVSACTEGGFFQGGPASPGETALPETQTGLRPMPRPARLDLPPANARTAEDFDTTTDAQRAAATNSGPPAGGALGTTIVSLGNPAEPGFWLKTPLVSERQAGKVVLAGKTVEVELIPTGDAPGAGSRMSLPALRLLGVALTDLPEVQVFAG